jgi:putative sterol carrier protein
VVYGLSIADGAAEMALGEVTDADLEVTNDYATAVGISTGELNTQMAFMTGKLKVTGDMAKLMLNQHVINAFAPALSGLDVEY